jgi:hypothetical protein
MAALSGPTWCTCEKLSRDGSACLLRRGVHTLHMVFLFRLSPKVDKNHNLSTRAPWLKRIISSVLSKPLFHVQPGCRRRRSSSKQRFASIQCPPLLPRRMMCSTRISSRSTQGLWARVYPPKSRIISKNSAGCAKGLEHLRCSGLIPPSGSYARHDLLPYTGPGEPLRAGHGGFLQEAGQGPLWGRKVNAASSPTDKK